jgi:DeoR/GlpR family transcriptional regulator of sugar metabolism
MSKQLIPAQRRERIRECLEVHQVVRSADLCNMLKVSEATIRRDLEWLENQGVLERTHGGAIRSQRMQEKRRIGALAATLVEDGDVIFVNSGTSTTQVITHIRSRADVTLITSNVKAVLEIPEIGTKVGTGCGFELVLLGGSFWPRSNSVMGRFSTETLRQIYASKAFIGVDGISLKYGCTVPTSGEAEIIRLMIQRTRGPVTVVADHSKWGVVSGLTPALVPS